MYNVPAFVTFSHRKDRRDQCSREKSNQNVDIEKEFTVHGDFEL